jgi:ATP-dependent exoDNAse (exonuclease V) beta subunit
MTDRDDAEARRRILTEFGTTFFVEAAAGTGKTTALVGRMVGLVRSGAGRLAGTVAVTFTEKAAGEMKLRLRLDLEKARADAGGEERRRLDRALEELELARIGTIHAFCGDLLSERPIEAGVDPLFKVAPDDEAEAIADEAFERYGYKKSLPIRQRVCGAFCEGGRWGMPRRINCGKPCAIYASTGTFQPAGDAILSTERVRLTR